MIEILPTIKTKPSDEEQHRMIMETFNILIAKINELAVQVNYGSKAFDDLLPLIRHFRED